MPPSMSPAPHADRAPAQGPGQATISLVNRRASFFRSVDIKLLIVVDMPGWRLFASLESPAERSWSSSTPARAGLRRGEQGTSAAEPGPSRPWLPVPPFAKVGFNVTRNILQSPNSRVTCSCITKHREMLFAPSLGAEQSQDGWWAREAPETLLGELVN